MLPPSKCSTISRACIVTSPDSSAFGAPDVRRRQMGQKQRIAAPRCNDPDHLSFMTFPIFTRLLTPSNYGIEVVVLSMLGLAALLGYVLRSKRVLATAVFGPMSLSDLPELRRHS